jgi:hypothetical protein
MQRCLLHEVSSSGSEDADVGQVELRPAAALVGTDPEGQYFLLQEDGSSTGTSANTSHPIQNKDYVSTAEEEAKMRIGEARGVVDAQRDENKLRFSEVSGRHKAQEELKRTNVIGIISKSQAREELMQTAIAEKSALQRDRVEMDQIMARRERPAGELTANGGTAKKTQTESSMPSRKDSSETEDPYCTNGSSYQISDYQSIYANAGGEYKTAEYHTSDYESVYSAKRATSQK